MAKQTDNLPITEYLLGSLPESHAEHFDELSLSDDAFSETLGVAEKNLVDAYVQGELSGSELERFESYYLASPLRREKVQFALAFQTLGEARPFVHEEETPKRKLTDSVANEEWWNWLSAFNFSGLRVHSLRLVGALAVLIVVILCGWLIFENLQLRQELSQTLPAQSDDEKDRLEKELAQVREERDRLEGLLAEKETEVVGIAKGSEPSPEQPRVTNRGVKVATFILKAQLRSIGQITTVSIPDNATHISFRLELEPNDYTAYRANLINDDKTLWRSGTLKPITMDSIQSVTLSFGAHLLETKIYILRLNGISADSSEVLNDYPFKVVK